MIPTKKEVVQVTSTLDGPAIGMTVDEGSLAHIMEVLTNLYSDDETAVLREYTTNARDSHVEANNPAPIEITLPTTLSPFLKIKDFGIGLDERDIRNIYSRYGLSTKTDTNAQTGSLGLGCKSALAYTHQFIVVGIKHSRNYSGDRGYMGAGEGGVVKIKTTVSVSKDDEGVGTMQIVDVSPTEEAPGVEITIPAKRFNDFERKARELFRFWPEGSVLINGTAPDRLTGGLKINDEITLYRNTSDVYHHYVVMGNIPYPIDNGKFDMEFSDGYWMVATIPNGSVHFAPNREQLRYTKFTRDCLTRVKETLKRDLLVSINKEIAAAGSMPEALRIAIRWRSALSRALQNTVFRYRDIDLPDSIQGAADGEAFLVAYGHRETDYNGTPYRVGRHSRMRAIDLVMVPDAIWVYGFNRTFTPNVKKKLWMHCDIHNRDYPENFIMCQTKPTSPWIGKECLIDWAVIDPLKVPRINPTTGKTFIGGRIPGSYDMYFCVDGDMVWMDDVPGDDIETDMPIYFFRGKRESAFHDAKRLREIEDDFTLVVLTHNRVAKFQRLFPGSRPCQEGIKEHFEYWLSTLTEREKQALALRQWQWKYGSYKFIPRVIDDPQLERLRKIYEESRSHAIGHLYVMLSILGEMDAPKLPENPFARYPLFTTSIHSHSVTARKHNRFYLNTAYQTFYKEQISA